MIEFLLLLLSIESVFVVGAAWALHVQAARFSRIDDQWRERERQLVDRLLRTAHVPPLEVQREQVLKLPDPELTPTAETWVDLAMRRDSIKEELEQVYPEAAHMPVDAVEERWPREWKAIQNRLMEQETPLRVS